MPLYIFTNVFQLFCLSIMGREAYQQSFYPSLILLYSILRYILIIATYFMFSKDYKSIAETMLIRKQFAQTRMGFNYFLNVYFRFFVVALNEFVIFRIIITTNLGEQGGLGLIINFSSALLISQFDDCLYDCPEV